MLTVDDESGDVIPFYNQGDADLNTAEVLSQRLALRQASAVLPPRMVE